MNAQGRVIVAGSGAFGLACALALADAGYVVEVRDPAPVGSNASGVAAGMLAPVFEAVLDPGARDHFGLLMAARDLWPEFAFRGGVALHRAGALAVGPEAWLETTAARMTALGAPADVLSGVAAQALAPGLSTAFPRALLSREDWRLDAQTALKALRHAAESAGVVFRPEAVTGRGDADLLVVATGAGQALADVAPELATLTPIKGHILRAARSGAGGLTVRTQDGYAVPDDGALTVGATMEVGVGDATVDPSHRAGLEAVGSRLFPDMRTETGNLSAGVRAATADGLPLIGPGAAPGVLLAVGARRNGWLLAPLAAREIVAWARGQGGGPYAAQLSPGRFVEQG